ncbi:hypothetical protein BpHYR1_003987 [Brachionus plicatilis]|uniref:Uncharacterized protein n=1 Tax=Brachionus plicatilis TaxID=10195 RepID=A0A3M7T0R0_BRAPC|nr:hypothetical protein BpHYR1_003987 [Brachionus plicatilis]RNA41616.1 hypothetical protein BpHYR1_003987 [Brachionus plicatilis]
MIKFILIIGLFMKAVIANSISRDEQFALSRDGFGRNNPDELFSGFFAPWPFVLYLLAGTFGFISLVSILAYTMGICRNPKK